MTIFNGTAGSDSIQGTAGNDVFNYGAVTFDGATIVGTRGVDTIRGGGGYDVLNFVNLSARYIDWAGFDADAWFWIQPTSLWEPGSQDIDFGGVQIVDMFAASGSGLIDRINFADAYWTWTLDAGVFSRRWFETDGSLRSVLAFGREANDSIAGSASNDTLAGNGGDDTIAGLLGNDHLEGSDGADSLRGGGGNDVLNAGSITADADSLSGGDGDDTLTAGAGNDLIDGGAGSDSAGFLGLAGVIIDLVAGSARDAGPVPAGEIRNGVDTLSGIEHASGGFGHDRLTGNSSANRLDGFGGDDAISGGAGNDTLDGDSASAGEGADTLRGGDGDDRLHGDGRSDLLDGGAGVDWADYTTENDGLVVDLVAGIATSTAPGPDAGVAFDTLTGIENVQGSDHAGDTVSGSSAANLLAGLLGDDSLTGLTGNDTLLGGAGRDTLRGGTGNDWLDGGSGVDSIAGNEGSDTYVVTNVADLVVETASNGGTADLVRSTVTWSLAAVGNTAVEKLTLLGTDAVNGTGNALANRLIGNDAANLLSGAAGNDSLHGGSGRDTLIGGAGNDSLTGGPGNDVFRFVSAPNAASNVDRLDGFLHAADRIELDDAAFAGIGAVGALAATAFRAGAVAADASDRIVYDSATGRLYFDADGTGSGGAILFATVTAGVALTAADIVVV